MPKATRFETATRIETVRQLILSGSAKAHIIHTVSEKWAITDRQAHNYFNMARAGIEQLAEQAKPYLLAEHISVRRDIRRRAREAHDLRAELAAAQDEAKLFGLYPSEKVEIFDWRKEAEEAGMTKQEQDALANELFSKVGQGAGDDAGNADA